MNDSIERPGTRRIADNSWACKLRRSLAYAQPERSMLTILLIVALLLALGGGGWGHSRYGYVSWSPAGVILIILLVMLFTGVGRL